MNREYHRWFSPSLGRDMELLIFGHAGARVLVFPSSLGSFFEWEDRRGEQFGIPRMLDVLRASRDLQSEEIIRALYGAVREFADDVPQSDDLTALVVRKL